MKKHCECPMFKKGDKVRFGDAWDISLIKPEYRHQYPNDLVLTISRDSEVNDFLECVDHFVSRLPMKEEEGFSGRELEKVEEE
jgi:hypothetical protein